MGRPTRPDRTNPAPVRLHQPTAASLLATGEVKPVIDRTYPLDQAADALCYIAAGHTRGKVVITL
ncbi:MAG: zinc-binding dehydrogenase [Propioniciclava sp.]